MGKFKVGKTYAVEHPEPPNIIFKIKILERLNDTARVLDVWGKEKLVKVKKDRRGEYIEFDRQLMVPRFRPE